MTLDKIIKELNKSGCNSKQKVIDMLTNADINELKELQRDIKEKIALKEASKNGKYN